MPNPRRSNATFCENQTLRDSGFFAPYAEYNRTIRNWFIAYGAGGPALVLTQESLRLDLESAGTLGCVGSLFLIGITCQVLSTLLNKWTNWCMYYLSDVASKSDKAEIEAR